MQKIIYSRYILYMCAFLPQPQNEKPLSYGTSFEMEYEPQCKRKPYHELNDQIYAGMRENDATWSKNIRAM